MTDRAHPLFNRGAVALVLLLAVAGCTKAGQFDPTEAFNSDVFDTKKKLKGDRIPVFPDGVPGATTGVPPDLVKGYQQPPDQPTDADAAVPGPTPPADPEAQKPAEPPPTRITIGAAPKSSNTQQQPVASQSVWPAAPQAGSAQQAAQPSQSVWPNPPAPSTSSR